MVEYAYWLVNSLLPWLKSALTSKFDGPWVRPARPIMAVPPAGVRINLNVLGGSGVLWPMTVAWTVCVAWPTANVREPDAAS